MKKDFINKIEKEIKRHFAFIIRCDDKNRPKEILSDMYFKLYEIEKLNEILNLCEEYKLQYDFAVESYDYEIDCIEQEICFISNNYKNA